MSSLLPLSCLLTPSHLVISRHYFILNYNAESWLLPSLTCQIKTMRMSSSASPLKLCCPAYDRSILFLSLHLILKHPTPNVLTQFKNTLLLYKTYNSNTRNQNWLDIFFNQNFKERNNRVNFFDTSRYKPGKNHLANRFTVIKNKIPYNWLNLPLIKYK